MLMRFTEHNSAHNEDAWKTSWDRSSMIQDDSNHLEIYNHFKFNDNTEHGLLVTHTYPDYQLLSDRFDDVKIILIGMTDDVFLEVLANSLLKNGFDLYPKTFNKESSTFSRIKRAYKDITNNQYDPDSGPIPIDIMREIFHIELRLLGSHRRKEADPFMTLEVPKHFENRTLVIQYEELFEKTSNSYSGLEKLSTFTGTVVNPSMVYNYHAYVRGQENLIQNKLPWIKRK